MMPENRLLRVLTALATEPWLLPAPAHKLLTQIAMNHAAGGAVEAEQHAAAVRVGERPQKREYAIVNEVAVIPLEGYVGRKFSSALYSSGVTSIDVFQRLVDTAALDDQIRAIVLSVDSPGGLCMGTPEAAAAVVAANGQKPVVAYADGLMCSAAYWLAAGAAEIVATPSAEVGSIGCYMAILDQSRAAELAGLHVQLFTSGKFKGMGLPGTSLTREQEDLLQANVDRIANDFKGAVRAGRGQIADDTMQGQAFSVPAAIAAGLVDSAGTMDDAMSTALALANGRKQNKGQGVQK